MGVGAILVATGLIVLALWLRQGETRGDEVMREE